MLSSGLTADGTAATGAGAARVAAGAARVEVGAAAPVRGGLGAWTGAAALAGAEPVATGAPAGPPGGSVGSLIVGAADGLGGKLIRTVSFLGWTLPVSFFGGTAPIGTLGIFSAITFNFIQPKVVPCECQTLIRKEKVAAAPGRQRTPLGKCPG